jgi:hypothetical protein
MSALAIRQSRLPTRVPATGRICWSLPAVGHYRLAGDREVERVAHAVRRRSGSPSAIT